MNLKRKSELQERRINSLTNQIERLRTQNELLRRENIVLSERVDIYKTQLESVEDIKQEYINGLGQIREIKENYTRIMMEARLIKNEYENKFRQLIKIVK